MKKREEIKIPPELINNGPCHPFIETMRILVSQIEQEYVYPPEFFEVDVSTAAGLRVLYHDLQPKLGDHIWTDQEPLFIRTRTSEKKEKNRRKK